MKIYWTDNSIPEMAHLSKEERVMAVRACKPRVYMQKETWAAAGVVILLGVAGQMLGFWIGDTLGYPYRNWLPPIGCFVFGIPSYVLLHNTLFVEQMRPHLSDYVEKHFQKQTVR